jgi:hypothetical protein
VATTGTNATLAGFAGGPLLLCVASRLISEIAIENPIPCLVSGHCVLRHHSIARRMPTPMRLAGAGFGGLETGFSICLGSFA